MGLTDEQCWNYTPREFSALEEIRRNYLLFWAVERADFRNVHFRGEDGAVSWSPEQMLGEHPIEHAENKMHPAIQQALIDHAMNKMPDWVHKLKDAKKQ